jgi:Ca2+-transporting ATPase
LNDKTLWAVTFGALLFLAVVIYVPPLAHLFRFASLGPLDVALCVGAGSLSVAWFELVKRRTKDLPAGASAADGGRPE